MRTLLTILLLLAVAVPASALDRRPRKKDKKKNKTEAVVTPPTAPVAEQQAAPEPEEPELPDPAEVQYDDMTLGLSAEQADSLVAVWRERQCGDSYQEFFDNYILVDSTAESTTPDSVYIQRLRALVSPIQLPYNNIVRGYINRYTDSRYGTISRILGMSQYYFPLIEDELLKEGLPVELRALPIIESALSTTAVSPMGAVGLWQFMPSTGKSYGLEVNSLVDERRDPVRSTQAACRYLKDLYAIYNDWSLAIAAYNCGPGNVNKAIARSGGNGRTFWDIYDYLPRETRGYVPAFIGASYAYAYHRQHGIELTEPAGHGYHPHRPADAPRADRLDDRHPDRDPAAAQPAIQTRYHPGHDQALYARAAAAQHHAIHRQRTCDLRQRLGLPQGVHQPGEHRQETPGTLGYGLRGQEGRYAGRHRPPLPRDHSAADALERHQKRP